MRDDKISYLLNLGGPLPSARSFLLSSAPRGANEPACPTRMLALFFALSHLWFPSDPQTINGKTVQTSIKVSPAVSYRFRSPAGLDAEANLTMGEYARVTTERKVPRNDPYSGRQWWARMTGASGRELRSQNALIASNVSQMGYTVTFMEFKARMSKVQLTRLEGKVTELTETVHDGLKELTENVTELKGKVDMVVGKVDTLTENVAELTENVTKLGETVHDGLKELTENVTELKGKVDTMVGKVDTLTENVTKLGEKVNQLPTRAEFYGFGIVLLILFVFTSWRSHTRCDKMEKMMNKMMNNNDPRSSSPASSCRSRLPAYSHSAPGDLRQRKAARLSW